MPELNIEAIQQALEEIREEFDTAAANFTIRSAEFYAYAATGSYANGTDKSFAGHGDTPEECIAELRSELLIHAASAMAATIETMALEIIRITHAHGSCCLSQLRQKFSERDLRLADKAAETAGAMADSGPFTVIDDGLRANSAA